MYYLRAHKYVYNLAKMRYSSMMADISAEQLRLENQSAALVRSFDQRYLHAEGTETEELTAEAEEAYARNAQEVVKRWWLFPDQLMSKYADGWLNDGA